MPAYFIISNEFLALFNCPSSGEYFTAFLEWRAKRNCLRTAKQWLKPELDREL